MNNNCYKPNINNPMGNFMPFDNRLRGSVCDTNNKETLDNLVSNIVDDSYKYNFNSQPVTNAYPDTTAFAKFLFPDPARCRDTGYLCKTNSDSTLNLDRLAYFSNEKYFQEINNNQDNENKNKFKIGGHTN